MISFKQTPWDENMDQQIKKKDIQWHLENAGQPSKPNTSLVSSVNKRWYLEYLAKKQCRRLRLTGSMLNNLHSKKKERKKVCSL